MKPFMKIDSIGELTMDVVLFESYYPILFTCLNEKSELFLCVCCQANSKGRKWLITKTTPNTIISVLRNKLTIREAFCKFPQVQITVFDNTKELLVSENSTEDWDYESSIELPDKDEFLDSEEEEFEEEISYYESMNFNNYNTGFDKVKVARLKDQVTQKDRDLFDEIDISDVYYKEIDLFLKNSEFYKQIKNAFQKILIDQYSNIKVSYNDIYEDVEIKTSKNAMVSQEYKNLEKQVKEVAEAA